ncbi:MAG: biotin--[acetyl-CoA-carboxylase] ligase [Spirochaetales bacterium]|nr:biotin--[acetyl-CoA-carboxylase] ligase [Spirochaetales bacterium]
MREINCINPWGSPVYYLDETESTMNIMASLDNPPQGTVVCAGYQSRGRGRGEQRQWASAPGENLLFSVVLDPKSIAHPLLRIPLICGLALSDVLKENLKLDPRLKWPNDVLVDRRKIAGILCEFRQGRFFLGMGVNCLQEDFPAAIRATATSLALLGKPLQPSELLETLLAALKSRLDTPEWKSSALNILYRMGEEVQVCEGPPENEKTISIKILGLSDEGFMIVEDTSDGRVREITAGEIRYKEL